MTNRQRWLAGVLGAALVTAFAAPGSAAPPAANAAPAVAEIVIPVYFHLVTNAGEGHWQRADVERVVQRLNEGFAQGFRPPPPGTWGSDWGPRDGTSAPAPFRFVLEDVDWTEDANWYNDTRYRPDDIEGRSLLAKVRKGGLNTLNVISPTGPGTRGTSSAFAPEWAVQDPQKDMIWLNPASFAENPVNPTAATIVHEAGHWLGLNHTFEGGCDGDDAVEDTPQHLQDSAPSFADPAPDSCPGVPGEDPLWNFMSYGFYARVFTHGQVERMIDQYQRYRAPARN
ncbi:M43 family zinc metalloprotease [Lentzea sp. NPDC060358]|uniref:M43 family zinc metalloprotease n=1 Tax=Lentzea sp. NPDC060358 TaxID=3347103 RepID=UPI003664CF22